MRVPIESLAFGGDAIGRADDGRVVFVPRAAPGDEVEIEITAEHKGYLRGESVRLLESGPTRVVPPCPRYLADCGGCQWLHVAASAQRAAKLDIVRRALRHVVAELAPLESPGPDLGWRRRARLRWRRPGSGPAVIGYARQRAHELIDIDACPQLEPALEAALVALRTAFADRLVGAGEIHLLLTTRGQVHAVLDGPELAGLEPLAAMLVGQGAFAGIALGPVVVGAGRVDLGDGDRPFWARADGFAQASAIGNDRLRALVRAGVAAAPGQRILELFSGSGNFTRDLAAAGARIVAVEESPVAVALAADNLAGWPVTLLAQPAAPPLPPGPFDAILVDPPRSGLEPELIAELQRLGAGRLIYVSCDPQTMARDLQALCASANYRVVSAIPIDLMPQTFHVEVVTVLARS